MSGDWIFKRLHREVPLASVKYSKNDKMVGAFYYNHITIYFMNIESFTRISDILSRNFYTHTHAHTYTKSMKEKHAHTYIWLLLFFLIKDFVLLVKLFWLWISSWLAGHRKINLNRVWEDSIKCEICIDHPNMLR